MKPQTTALIDQALAASGHAGNILRKLAELDGAQPREVKLGPIFTAMAGKLERTAAAGQLTLCPHLSWGAPAPSFWCAWAPGRLRCTPCTVAANKRIHGTIEDRRCDHCGRIRPTIHRDAMSLPPVVADLSGRAWCIPPVIALFGLCPACHNADDLAVKQAAP